MVVVGWWLGGGDGGGGKICVFSTRVFYFAQYVAVTLVFWRPDSGDIIHINI